MNRVSAQDAHEALIYKDGILDYGAHDRVLQGKGYSYLALPCNCGGNDDDGHMPCCGWGRIESTCPAMEHILGDSTGEKAEVCGATVEAGEMFCSQHKEEN